MKYPYDLKGLPTPVQVLNVNFSLSVSPITKLSVSDLIPLLFFYNLNVLNSLVRT